MSISQMEHNQINSSGATICAIATPPGIGGIAVIRVSGPSAIDCVNSLWKGKSLKDAPTHTAHLGYITDTSTKEPIDQCVATVFKAPATFTGDDTVEISVHGSQWIQQETLRQLIQTGKCRMAEPGEFTRRAFTNGRIDLSQAEAVADVIASTTRSSHRLAMAQMRGQYSRQIETLRNSLIELASLLELELDFSEEDVEFASRQRLKDIAIQTLDTTSRMAETFSLGKAIKDGIPVAIVGEPNAGKSTLLNTLVGDNRAIVSDIPGTTRDTIEDITIINGVQYRFIDTAGIRKTNDTIENLGIERSIETISKATIVIWLLTQQTSQQRLNAMAKQIEKAIDANAKLIICHNKIDLPTPANIKDINITHPYTTLHISALTGEGIKLLKQALHSCTTSDAITQPDMVVTNARHYQALLQAKESLQRIIDGLNQSLSGDFIAQDVRQTLHHLGEITGAITTPDILATIFSRFCIGK